MIGPAPMCMWCVHFRSAIGPIGEGGGRQGPLGCAAFPKPPGIPEAIIMNHHDHRQPYKGDHGILFEPKADASAEALERIVQRFARR